MLSLNNQWHKSCCKGLWIGCLIIFGATQAPLKPTFEKYTNIQQKVLFSLFHESNNHKKFGIKFLNLHSFHSNFKKWYQNLSSSVGRTYVSLSVILPHFKSSRRIFPTMLFSPTVSSLGLAFVFLERIYLLKIISTLNNFSMILILLQVHALVWNPCLLQCSQFESWNLLIF